MKHRCQPNLNRTGRLVRGTLALLLLVGAAFGFAVKAWLGLMLLACGALRACGIKTPL